MHYEQRPFDFNQYMTQTHQTLHAYQQRIESLESVISELDSTINQLKQQQPISINYKFDQLKIEKLEGTLNIGMSPNPSDSTLEEFEVGEQHVQTPGTEVEGDQTFETQAEAANFIRPAVRMVNAIQANIESYFKEQAVTDLQKIEEKYNYPLDEPYRQFIINDVRRQIPTRIEHYLKLYYRGIPDQAQLINEITNKLLTDIRKAFELFIQHLPKGNQT